jgi:hypothetical protein
MTKKIRLAYPFFAACVLASAAATARAEENGSRSGNTTHCGRTELIGNCGTGLQPQVDQTATGSLPIANGRSAVKNSALLGSSRDADQDNAAGPRLGSDDQDGAESDGKDHVNAGPGNGGEGAAGENGDLDPGNSAAHNHAPDTVGGKGKGHAKH